MTDTANSYGGKLVNPSDAGGGVIKECAVEVPKTTSLDDNAKVASANTPGGTACRDTTVEGTTGVAKEAGASAFAAACSEGINVDSGCEASVNLDADTTVVELSIDVV